MKIILPGATGQVGTVLARAFHNRGDEVVVLSRQPINKPWRVVTWDAESLGGWASEFEGADVVINLAGRSVNCRYNVENRRLITESRVKSTQVVGKAIALAWEHRVKLNDLNSGVHQSRDGPAIRTGAGRWQSGLTSLIDSDPCCRIASASPPTPAPAMQPAFIRYSKTRSKA